MAKRSSTRKSLKSLFSRSDADLDKSEQRDEDRREAEKKKFKLPKFKLKSKSGASSERSADDSQQNLSAADDGEAENVTSVKKSSVYATAPRSKGKELSYSELDLRKPKRFATFSLGLRKKKKQDEENISQSTSGLHSSSLNQHQENSVDLSPMVQDQSDPKLLLSLSQTELDTSGTFNISSPPPVASNQSESYFTIPVRSEAQSESQQSPPNDCDGASRAPIASISELQLDDSSSSEETEDVSVQEKPTSNDSAPAAETWAPSDVNGLPSKHVQGQLDTPDHKAVADSVLQRCHTAAEPVSAASPHQHSDNTNSNYFTHNTELLMSQNTSRTVLESADAPLSPALPLTDCHKASVPLTETSSPDAVVLVSGVSGQRTCPVSQDSVYGALYESLFPRSFNSEVLSSLLNRQTQVTMGPPATETETVSVNPPHNFYMQTDMKTPSRLTHDSAAGFSCSSDKELASSSLTQQKLPQIELWSDQVPHSEQPVSHSELKAQSQGLFAAPVSVTSPGTDAQVTQSKRRVVLVKQFIPSDSPAPTDRMTAPNTKAENFSEPFGQTDGSDRPLSPAYLSVGSDEGSVMEIYYSAQEDNMEDSEEEDKLTVDEDEAVFMAEGGKESELQMEDTQRGGASVRGTELEHQGNKTSCQEAADVCHTEGKGQRSEDQLLHKGNSEFFQGQILKREEKRETATAQIKEEEEGEGRREEELLAPPVQQVSSLMECDSTPPSTDPQVEGNWAKETEDPSKRELQPLSLQGWTLVPTDIRSPDETQGGSCREEAGEEVLPTAAEEEENVFIAENTNSVLADTCAAEPTGRLTPDAVPHGREGAGTMTQSTDGNSATHQQVPVELVWNADTQPSERRTAALDPAEDHSFQPSSASVESVDTMSSSYSSLSTKLTLKSSSPPKEDESKPRFHKVSLVKDADSSPDPGSEYRWKNRFEGVTQFKPQRTSFTESFISNSSSFDSSSAFPEDTEYRHLSSSYPVTLDNSLSDRPSYLSHNGEADEMRWSFVEEAEPPAPADEVEGQTGGEAERRKSEENSEQLPASSLSSINSDDSSRFSGVFKATLVDLVSEPAAPPSSPPSSPDIDSPNQYDMDSLVDTLKSMGPSLMSRGTGVRPPPPVLVSSLPPIVEDTPNLTSSDEAPSLVSPPKRTEESPNGLYTLPADLGLKRSTRETRSPLELMKNSQDSNSPLLNGNGSPLSPPTSSRLDSSVIFSCYRSSSTEQTQENGTTSRPLFRTSSLPETGPSNEGVRRKETGEVGAIPEAPGSRLERLSFLLNSSSSGSLSGAEDPSTAQMSRSPFSSLSPPPSTNSPTHLFSPTSLMDLRRPFPNTESPFSSMFIQGPGALQRSLGSEGGPQMSLFNSIHEVSQFQNQQTEPDRNLTSKYRAFPDAYLTKEKEHGKLNPRPGKMYIFDRPGMCGQRTEIRGDVIDATSLELQETISIRVVRGGWVLYEKPDFKGEKFALDEGDIELTCPFSPPEEELQNGQEEEEEQNGGDGGEQMEKKSERRFIIGSIRRAVRDYSVPEICLFPEENAEGKKVVFRDTSEDARIFGFPIKANSIIVHAGLWLVFAHPFFEGPPRVLEVGGYSNPAAWGVVQPYVGSVHPLKVGEPKVENLSDPKMVIYDKPYFTGKSRTISSNMRDFMTRTGQHQTVLMHNVGSLKVLGGIWVGYEKEGFRGHQYLLEEGEYHDWRVWGGCDSELRSVRIIQADLTDPLMMMFEQPEEEAGVTEENTFEVTEAIPDVELFDYKTSTRSIHVLSGAWIAYSHVDFSGNQYILEKGFYSNCADWGSQDTRICSVQPILLAPPDSPNYRQEIILCSEPDFQGDCLIFHHNQGVLPEKFIIRSCRVVGGSWILYENKQFSGNMYILSEDNYPNLTSMGCPSSCSIQSIKQVPMMFSVPSISLFGLEGLEGREITAESEVVSLVQEGLNNHILSVRVNSGCWVICEYSNYRGRQFLLEPIEITNWPKFSLLHAIGSMYPIRQRRRFFRVRNRESGHFLSVQGGVEEMKSGRVVATQEVEPLSDIWFYQDGLIKNKMSPIMSLQVMGNVEPAAKVVLWSETRQPIQTWSAQMSGLISSLTFPGMVLDVKGGKTYDKEHVVVMLENDERPSQQWEIELLM